ncbi:hypothetical protein [uncultured Mailhella sp.]|uniref:hypothetical protein n=1 Tax=uncultured Mailhella sp. TaxID=1981031 RepID=UPI0025E9EFD2|nr:hypothetical protein [uncultured Mailhella sp.]
MLDSVGKVLSQHLPWSGSLFMVAILILQYVAKKKLKGAGGVAAAQALPGLASFFPQRMRELPRSREKQG